MGLIGGFFVFADRAARVVQVDELPRADGIVVWTGKGGGRLEMAGRLLESGRGERLLVSGVNTQLDAAEVAALSGLSATSAACCLDIDYAAQDTRGNAVETAAWAQALGYDHVILVTSAYHMPRAQVELGHASEGLRVTPAPVGPAGSSAWWRDAERFRRLVGEYGKLLISLARGRAAGRSRLPDAPELPSGE